MTARLCLTLLLLLAFPAAASAQAPQTGFEARGGSSFTTLAEETSYLTALDSTYGTRADVSVVGKSVQGRPLRLVRAGTYRTQAEIAAGSSILLVCSQHGNEPAGREGCLEKARNHAAGTSATSLLVMPTANPDGTQANSRYNASGVDVNRDHSDTPQTPEARAIKYVQDTYRPDITLDMHEYSDAHRLDGDRVEHSWSKGRAPAAIDALSYELVYTWIEPGLRGDGFLTGPYGDSGPSADLVTLNGAAGSRYTVGALVETPREGLLSRLRRVEAQYTSATEGLRMRYARAPDLAAATARPDPVQSSSCGAVPAPALR